MVGTFPYIIKDMHFGGNKCVKSVGRTCVFVRFILTTLKKICSRMKGICSQDNPPDARSAPPSFTQGGLETAEISELYCSLERRAVCDMLPLWLTAIFSDGEVFNRENHLPANKTTAASAAVGSVISNHICFMFFISMSGSV